MTDRPIIFSGPMVRAILEGRKTQTRRVLKQQPPEWCSEDSPGYSCLTPKGHIEFRGRHPVDGYGAKFIKLPYEKKDRLWVREAWTTRKSFDDVKPSAINRNQSVGYIESDEGPWQGKIRPSIFMPRWASRITLIVTDVRVERLQDISEEDAATEGLFRHPMPSPEAKVYGCDWTYNGEWRSGSPVSAFASLWDSINGNRLGCTWQDNPWVCAVTFDPIYQNIDQIAEDAA